MNDPEQIMEIPETIEDTYERGCAGAADSLKSLDIIPEEIAAAVHHEGLEEVARCATFTLNETITRLKTEIEEWGWKFAKLNARRFSVMPEGYPGCPSSIPWRWIEHFDKQAQINHSQSLEHLNSRGGLSVCELLAVVNNRRWHRMTSEEATKQFLAWIDKQSGREAEVSKLVNRIDEATAILSELTAVTPYDLRAQIIRALEVLMDKPAHEPSHLHGN
jgi:hypothetical protein